LAEFFLRTHANDDKPAVALPPLLRDALLEHEWPGNIRELENVMRKFLVMRNAEAVAEELLRRAHKRSLALRRTPVASRSDVETGAQATNSLPAYSPPKQSPPPEPSILKNVDTAHRAAEAEVILSALNAALWNRKQAATLLKIEYKALLYKMKKLGIGDKSS
jgi:two-component system response regulator AtoC